VYENNQRTITSAGPKGRLQREDGGSCGVSPGTDPTAQAAVSSCGTISGDR